MAILTTDSGQNTRMDCHIVSKEFLLISGNQYSWQ